MNDRAPVDEFARGWLAANLDPGPFSVDDGPVGSHLVDKFIIEAKEYGLSQAQLDQSLGDVRVYLQRAFDEAALKWRSKHAD